MAKNNTKIHQAVDLTSSLDKNFDMTDDESNILNSICKIGFFPIKNIWRSSYWGKNLGASHWLGRFNNVEVVLKIQGAKPNISEVDMISNFELQNISKKIRAPKVLYHIPWSDEIGYEVIITDYISGKNVLIDGKVVNKNEVSNFFSFYQEYRKNCLPNKPWIDKPIFPNNFEDELDKIIVASNKAFPNNKLRHSEDLPLAIQAAKLLTKFYKNVELEFIHGHFSCKDLIYEDKENSKVVLFSNLFWKWRHPYFDAVFAYHWFMYELSHVQNITPKDVESQRKLWIDEIYKVTGAIESKDIRTLVDAALLERAVSGFIIDSFLCDQNKPISKYLYESTKKETRRLIEELSIV